MQRLYDSEKLTGMDVEGGGHCLHETTTVSRNLPDVIEENHENPEPG
jgi:hypothetical protein